MPRRNLFYLFFCPLLRGRHDAPASSPIVIALHPIAPTVYHRRGRLLAGCCVPPSSGSHRNSRPRRTLYFNFFRRSICRPKRQVNVLPTRSAPLIPATDTIVRLVVVSNQRVAATQDRCSAAHLSIFRWVQFRRPKQGNPPQCARSRAPGACVRLIGSHGAEIWVHGGCCCHGE